MDPDLSNFMDILEITTTHFMVPPNNNVTLQYMTPSNNMKIVANDKDVMDMFKNHLQVGSKVIHIYSRQMPVDIVGSSQLTWPNIPIEPNIHDVLSDGDGSNKDYHEDEEDQNNDLLVDEDKHVSEEENMEDDCIYMANIDSGVEDDEVEGSTDEEELEVWNGNENIYQALCVGMKFTCKKEYGATTDCKWRIYAIVRRIDGTTIEIRKIQEEHSCPRTSNVPYATSVWLAEKIGDNLGDDREKSITGIMREVQRDYGVTMSYSQVRRAKKKAMALIEGNQDDQYRMLPRYLEAIVKWNPGSVGFMEGCRPFIGLDGTHLKTICGGVLLCAISLDANQTIFPVALPVVEIEDQHSWGWFLQCLKDAIGPWQHQALNFISDRQKGLLNAFDRVMPGARHRFCVRHLYNNFKVKYPGRLLKNALWSASNAFNKVEFKKHMDELKKLNSEAFNWLSSIPDWAWCRHAFDRHTKAQENVTICANHSTIGLEQKGIHQL
ncbi:uncharacterized protein LOC122651377 [Telopea speciosissima]|uniref:uncharacterized protein LOC122651377 n=1 Tax=Telopea speciosissima TaxID=54955 RepID=UPI001CC72C9E|nr:uncharacterized protein LOC122651377 [Telopea speciosissima]